jgi:hypothetical protein
MSEIGIPYDMDNKRAYTDGNYHGQYAAMDANNYALEGAGLSYTLWTYCPDVSTSARVSDCRTIMFGATFGTARISASGANLIFRETYLKHLTINRT